jgi:parallel beta-helix repeat protein
MHPIETTDPTPALLTRRLPCPDGPPRHGSFRLLALVAAVVTALAAPDATAALARYSDSNNRIYVYGGGSMNLSGVRASTGIPAEALQRVDDINQIWLLNANIIVEEGTTLSLTGDVKELRLKSNPSSAPLTEFATFVGITAGNFDATAGTGTAGTILIDGVKVTSWDTAANAPDTNSADGRAYIRARSGVGTGGPQISRLDVLNSEVQYLGFEASERYGLAWKANGTEEALASDVVYVLGDVKNSKIHHNHYGVYSFGLLGSESPSSGHWTGNEVYSNDGYGLDAHDHSDDLVIDGNNVHDNGHVDPKGKHGIILSEKCVNAQITNNTSNGNFGNGIMLHNFADNAIVEGNTATGNGDAGVALFCSSGALVKGNTLTNNAVYGIRLTVAAKGNTVEANTIAGSGEYGIFMQPATDSNNVCGDLTPRENTFTGNTVTGSGITGLKVTDATNNTFDSNTIEGGASIRNSKGVNTTQVIALRNNTFGAGGVVRLDGDAAQGMLVRADFTDTPHVTVSADTGSTAHFADDAGAIFDLLADHYVQVTGSNSSFDLTNTGGANVEVDTRALFVTTDGTLVEVAPTTWETSGDRNKAWIARAATANGAVQYKVGDLQSGVSYDVTRNGTAVGTFSANATNDISFSDTPGTTETVTYQVKKAANQPQSGGGGSTGGGGGGAGDLAWMLGLLVVALRRAIAR